MENLWTPKVLEKKIFTHPDLYDFLHCTTYKTLVGFIELLGSSIQGTHETPPDCLTLSPLLDAMDSMQKFIGFDLNESTTSRYFYLHSNFRYGNPKFRNWHAKMVGILETKVSFLSVEFREYFCASFGNLERLDYGTGHELHFICSLYCLYTELQLEHAELKFLVLVLFKKYLMLVHSLLRTYLLEPAGSHGVWGLDDYHFLPYLFGASQAIGHPHLRPKSMFNPDAVTVFKDTNLYFLMIAFLSETKRFSLKWNSPMLNDISQINDWKRIHDGLLRMYIGEILGKLPIMQHFLFGTVLDFQPSEEREQEPEIVIHQFQPCCANIKIPSIYFLENKEMPYD